MDTFKEILGIAIVAACAAFFIKMLINTAKGLFGPNKASAQSVVARVTAKHAETGSGNFKEDGLRKGRKLFTVDFETESGEEISLEAGEREYNIIEEGTSGVLNYRENRLLNFAPDKLCDAGKEDF